MNPNATKILEAYIKASEEGAARLQRRDPPKADPLDSLLKKITMIKGDKGDKGDRGFIGETGKSIVGPVGPRGPAGRDGIDGKDGIGIQGPRGPKGEDGNANLTEVIDVAQTEVRNHEKKNDHALLHDSLTIGSKIVDETDIGEGKVQIVQGKKLVYRPLPKAGQQMIHGGGISRIRKNSTGDGFNKSRLNFIEGSNITITMVTDDDKAETDITIASSGGGGGSSISFADRETPTGAVDGANTVFTLLLTPSTNSEYVYLGGVTMLSGYTLVGNVLTFDTAPEAGTELKVSYRTSGSSSTITLRTYRAITTAQTLLTNDEIVDCTAGTFTTTLPTAVGVTGKEYTVKNSGVGIITVATTSSQTIDGASTKTLSAKASITVLSTGSNWIVL